MAVNPNTLDLKTIVDVVVEISPLAAPRPTFNQALIVGTSLHIPSIGTNPRLRAYESLAAMASDGFQITDPEYIAAELYFGQSPAPNIVWIGRQDLTAPISAATVHTAGSGYSSGDVLTVVQSGGSLGTIEVKTIGETGNVLTLDDSTLVPGTGYTTATGLSTTVDPSGGSGAKVSITATGETALQALQACRAKNFTWYACMVCGSAKADHIAIAGWIQDATPSSVYFFTTSDAETLEATEGNVFDALNDLSYNRAIGQYSTTLYACAAIMGYAMGQNTGLANSAYTLKFKQEVGVDTEALSLTQIGNIEGDNGNAYLSYGNYYKIFEQGTMANGQFFDEIINLDMLTNNIQLSVMDLLYGNPKIPDTDPGVTQIIHAINIACEEAVTLGFLAPGTWLGSPILNLSTGDMLVKGYLVQAPAVKTQSISDRSARKSPPIYVAIKEAGAIHSVLIGVYVDR